MPDPGYALRPHLEWETTSALSTPPTVTSRRPSCSKIRSPVEKGIRFRHLRPSSTAGCQSPSRHIRRRPACCRCCLLQIYVGSVPADMDADFLTSPTAGYSGKSRKRGYKTAEMARAALVNPVVKTTDGHQMVFKLAINGKKRKLTDPWHWRCCAPCLPVEVQV
ncbi:hypothetical protein COCNU_03G013370 [Cocos nucifera]|uniref:Uncharacterized protein n=1 Tax=Cocos nucifera TaxID=13894 RepID=A0A8K0MZ74_COCNU|nr:hypothetical protein COCNU_03G013370 [Cocos nucifera]